MKICVVSPSYPTSKTIVFMFVDQLCRAMADNGVEVMVIAPLSISRCIVHHEPLVKFHTKLTTEKGNVIDLYRPKYLSFGNGRLSKFSGFNRAVKNAFKKLNQTPDILYGHFWSSIFAILPLSINYKIPLFGASGEESVAFYDSYSFEQKSQVSSHLKGLICVSTKNRDECISRGLINNEKTIVIPNAANLALFRGYKRAECRKALGICESDFVVAFMGQFVPRKGTMRLDKALKLINDNSIKAMFIGSGIEEPNYDGIIFKGRLDHDMIPQYLASCDVFVLPTDNEGCSNAIVEALACGLPIISSDAPFNYDILNDKNSILINSQDVNQIADAIRKVKNNPSLRSSLSEGARIMADGLSLERRAERIIQFINERK